MASDLNTCNGVTGGNRVIQGTVNPPVHVKNPCFLRTSGSLNFNSGSGVLSIELPALTRVGFGFEVVQQADLTRIVLSELRTVIGNFRVNRNPMLTYLSIPKLASSRDIGVCGNSQDFTLPPGTWPAVKPNFVGNPAFCVFQAGSTACPDTPPFCSNFAWPS
jgi:hypothetical protein